MYYRSIDYDSCAVAQEAAHHKARHSGYVFMLAFMLAVTCIVALSVSARVETAYAAEITAEGTFRNETAQWSLDSDGLLSITGTGLITDTRSYDYSTQTYSGLWSDYTHDVQQVYVSPDVTIANFMYWFANCDNLTSIDTSSWNINSTFSTVTGMFSGCSNMKTADVTGLVGGKVMSLSSMFQNCSSLVSLTGVNTWNTSGVSYNSSLFDGCSSLQSIDVTGLVRGAAKNCYGVFRGCSSLTSVVGLASWDTSNVTECSNIFDGCSSLQSIDVTGLVRGAATRCYGMFRGCSSLTSVAGLSSWDTSNVTECGSLFNGCSSLTSVAGLSSWDTSNVTECSSIFDGCSSLQSIDVTGLVRGAATRCYGMFRGCSSLTSVAGLASWDTSNVTECGSLFDGCSSLQEISGLSSWNTSSIMGTSGMFLGCSSLGSIDVSSFDLRNAEHTAAMFADCDALVTIKLGSNWSFRSTLADADEAGRNSVTLPGDSDVIWKEQNSGLTYSAEYLQDHYDGATMAGTYTREWLEQGKLTRLAGEATAADTSAVISGKGFYNGSDWVLIARDDDFADAMSATGLAGTLEAPIILTDRESLSASAREEIRRLGATKAYVIGGSGAIKDAVVEELESMNLAVNRVFGSESWDTSVACADKISEHGGNPGGYAIVAMSSNFQDALSISAFAFAYNVPILLETSNQTLTEQSQAVIDGLDGTIFVAGGNGAVPTASVEDVFAGREVVRMAGVTGYDTSNQIATYMVDNGYLSGNPVGIACGAQVANGSDALSGAALVGWCGGVMLLTNSNPDLEDINLVTITDYDSEGTPAFLSSHTSSILKGYILGGTVVATSDLMNQVAEILKD